MCNCPAHFGLVDCTCRCDHTADRMLQWRARADALAATVQRVRDLCDAAYGNSWTGPDTVLVYDLRAALASSDPATDTGGEGRGDG